MSRPEVLEGRVADAGGTPLYARRAGDAPPVLFVYGSASVHRTWDGAFEAAAERFTAIAYGRRGHAPNPRPTDHYRFDEQLDAVLSVIGSLGRLALVGHSAGAVRLLATVRRPSEVRAAVLVEPPCFTLEISDPPGAGEMARLFLRDPRLAFALARFVAMALAPSQGAARRGNREAAIRCFGRGVLGRDTFARLTPERRRQAEENYLAAELIGPAFPGIVPAEVAGLDRPVLVVRGAESPVSERLSAERLAALLPRVELVTIDGASHIVHEDAPAAFARALLGFFERTR